MNDAFCVVDFQNSVAGGAQQRLCEPFECVICHHTLTHTGQPIKIAFLSRLFAARVQKKLNIKSLRTITFFVVLSRLE
jgi:hypothetical protein